jgi:hypothetical protein
MSNGTACCLLGVCCPPNSEAQRAALAKKIGQDFSGGAEARKYADWIIDNFDLAPKGTLDALKASIADMVRHDAR